MKGGNKESRELDDAEIEWGDEAEVNRGKLDKGVCRASSKAKAKDHEDEDVVDSMEFDDEESDIGCDLTEDEYEVQMDDEYDDQSLCEEDSEEIVHERCTVCKEYGVNCFGMLDEKSTQVEQKVVDIRL